MSKARQLAQRTNQSGRKNLIINGAFEIAQRSTSEVTGGGYTTVDRWRFPNASQKSQQVDNDRDISIPKMLKVTSNSSGYGITEHKIEDVTKTSGKTVTLSFWAKTSDYSNLRFYMYQNFGTSGSSDVAIVDNATYFSVPDTGWNKYTATLTCPSVSGKTINASNYLYFGIGPASGAASGVVYYSEVQLEVGSVATEFEHRSYGEELALCQRYYHQQERTSSPIAGVYIGIGQAVSTTQILSIYKLPQTMRIIPTLSLGGDASVGYGDSTGTDISTSQTVSAFYADNAHFSFYLNSTGVNQFDVCRVFLINNTSIKFDAEL